MDDRRPGSPTSGILGIDVALYAHRNCRHNTVPHTRGLVVENEEGDEENHKTPASCVPDMTALHMRLRHAHAHTRIH